jgi:hypothetical protein
MLEIQMRKIPLVDDEQQQQHAPLITLATEEECR